jgi:hypothetical protein
MDNFVWREDPTIHGSARNVIDPALTFEVLTDGSLMPFTPKVVRFREGRKLRPVAPFFELWANIVGGADDAHPGIRTPVPLTSELLHIAGGNLENLVFGVSVANRKAARRSGDNSNAFAATAQSRGDDHARRHLLASSAALPGGRPLVRPSDPIPLGFFQVIRPVRGHVSAVDLDVLRVRFTPAAGEVYGPPTAVEATDAVTGRAYEIVAPPNRILNPEASWLDYRFTAVDDSAAGADRYFHPEPPDTYDGADLGQTQSWGVVDDTCDGVITATLVIDGRTLSATARICVGPPDYAPDRRPFISLADDLADRELEPMSSQEIAEDVAGAQHRLADLFQRVWETASLTNLDAIRQRAVAGNESDGSPTIEGLPRTDDGSMRPQDVPFADANVAATIPSEPDASDGLVFTSLINLAHAPLADEDALVRFFNLQADRLRLMIRPAYGAFDQLKESVRADDTPDEAYRDPRITRDRLHDMRMPPYMRDETAGALSLTRRQYRELIGYLEFAVDVFARRAAVAGVGGTAISTPLRRRVDARLNMIDEADG